MSEEPVECGCSKYGQHQFVYWCPCIKDDALAMVECGLQISKYGKVIHDYEAGLLNEMCAINIEAIKHSQNEVKSNYKILMNRIKAHLEGPCLEIETCVHMDMNV